MWNDEAKKKNGYDDKVETNDVGTGSNEGKIRIHIAPLVKKSDTNPTNISTPIHNTE